MSKDLTDVDEFTSPVHVPEGIDSRDDAAGDVERIAQALANRTRHLKNILDAFGIDAAFEGQDNTFTGLNTFQNAIINAGVSATDAILQSNVMPTDLGGSIWRLVFSFKYAGGLYAQVYVGNNPSDINGIWAIVTNANWDPATAKWSQVNTSHGSTAIIWQRNNVRISWVAQGTAPWATWPTNAAFGKGVGSGSVNFEGQVNGDLRSSTQMVAPAMLVTGTAGDNYSGEYNYPLLSRTIPVIPLDLSTAYGDHVVFDIASSFGVMWSNTQTRIGFPIRLARGTQFQKVEMRVVQASSSPITLAMYRRQYSGGWTPGTSPALSAALASATTPGSSNNYTIVLDRSVAGDWGGMNGLDEWFLIVTHTAGQGDYITGLYLRDVIEPGPRNW